MEYSSSDFHVVTKKKKTKKRRNSLSGTRHKPSNATAPRSDAAGSAASEQQHRRRTSSPTVPRRKSVCSVPPSEKSNDSSDVDSVHSLPAASSAGGQPHRRDAPISYADIARNADKLPKKQFADAKVGSDLSSPPKEAAAAVEPSFVTTVNAQTQTTPPKVVQHQPPPPDVHNVKSFPAIGNNKVDKGMNTSRPPQQQQPQLRQKAAVRNVAQTVVASSQTCNVPELPQQQQQPQQPQRDLKTDLSVSIIAYKK